MLEFKVRLWWKSEDGIGQSMFLEMRLRSIWKTRNRDMWIHTNNSLKERTSLYTVRKTVTMWQKLQAHIGLLCKMITPLFASLMENGRGSSVWNQCHDTTNAIWVDDVKNQCHDPIGLDEAWATKWWPTRQFMFICSIAEVNAVNSQAHATKVDSKPQLTFCRNLAVDMLETKLESFSNNYHCLWRQEIKGKCLDMRNLSAQRTVDSGTMQQALGKNEDILFMVAVL